MLSREFQHLDLFPIICLIILLLVLDTFTEMFFIPSVMSQMMQRSK